MKIRRLIALAAALVCAALFAATAATPADAASHPAPQGRDGGGISGW